VIVDYLQLLGNTGKHDNRAQAVGANAWALKMIATDFQIPVLLLSQFSRASNKPGQKREPELTDLKETGDIENHANGVWFLHRENDADSNQIAIKFLLPKQRDGRRNIYQDFFFYPQYQRFEQVSDGDYE
jgi:replicative DNA helicase